MRCRVFPCRFSLGIHTSYIDDDDDDEEDDHDDERPPQNAWGKKMATHVQWKVQADDVRRSQQLLKFDVFRATGQVIIQSVSIVILDFHPKRLGLISKIPSNPAHAHDPQRLAFRVVTQRWKRLASPFPFA